MMRNIEKAYDLYKELIDAREERDQAKEELDDAEYNYVFTSSDIILKSLENGDSLENEDSIDLSNFVIIMKGHHVLKVLKRDKGIYILLDGHPDTKLLSLDDFTPDELYNLAMFLLCYKSGKKENVTYELEDDEDDVNDDEKPSYPLSVHKGKQIINDDVFWAVVKAIGWQDLLDSDITPCVTAKEKLRNMGYDDGQIKELKDIYMKYRSFLESLVKMDYSEKNFTDDRIVQICDYIISLGDETYADIFNGVLDLMDYVKPYTSLFVFCFS